MAKWFIGAALVLGTALAGCSSGGGPGVLVIPGSPDRGAGDTFLPPVAVVDSGIVTLTEGAATGTDVITLTEPSSGVALTVPAATRFDSDEEVYDTDADGDMDFVILTLRPLAVHAAQSVSARDAAGASAGGGDFYKIGGVAVLPLDAQTGAPVSVTIPVNSAGTPAAGKEYELYRWVPNWEGPLDDASTSAGYWQFVQKAAVDSNGTSVTFTTSQLGQFAIVTRVVTPPAPPAAT